MATADSQIVAFAEKYQRPHWRPITAIRARGRAGHSRAQGRSGLGAAAGDAAASRIPLGARGLFRRRRSRAARVLRQRRGGRQRDCAGSVRRHPHLSDGSPRSPRKWRTRASGAASTSAAQTWTAPRSGAGSARSCLREFAASPRKTRSWESAMISRRRFTAIAAASACSRPRVVGRAARRSRGRRGWSASSCRSRPARRRDVCCRIVAARLRRALGAAGGGREQAGRRRQSRRRDGGALRAGRPHACSMAPSPMR